MSTPLDPHAELLWLTRALQGHLQWAEITGSAGTPPVDEQWMQLRREQYRNLELSEEEAERPLVGSKASSQGDVESTETPPAPGPPRPVAANAAAAPPLQDAPRLQDAPPPQDVLGAPHTEGPPPAAARKAAAAPALPQFEMPSLAKPSAPAVPAVKKPRPTPRSLPQLEEAVRTCTRCALSETRTNTVFARGTGRSGICFIGEGPGQDEDLQGSPFVGKAGQLLDRMIAAMGLSRDDVYVCNIVKCRPPNNRKPQPAEMEACNPFLAEQLDALQPKVIVALGATAVEGLLGLTMGRITRLRGQWRLYQGQIPVMPTFHPAYLLRQPSAKREVWNDLQEVLKQVGLPSPTKS